MEYSTPEDAQKYGGGLKGYRETIVETKTVTYKEMTGLEPPESPVDHVITTPPVIATQPIPQPEKVETEKTGEVQEIGATEIQKPVEVIPNWDSLTDEQLKEMARGRSLRGFGIMKRETLITKLKTFYNL